MGLLGSGPTKTTTTNQNETGTSANRTENQSQQQQQGSNSTNFSNTTTPNLPSWYSSFLQTLPGQYSSLASSLSQSANTPLYGQPQQAAFQNQLNGAQAQSMQALQSQLASQGALNSGRGAQAQTQLALGGQQQLGNYLAQVPLLNAQNKQQNLGQLGGVLNSMSGFTSPINAYGTTQSGTQDTLTSLLNNLFSGSESLSNTSGTSNSTTKEKTTSNVLGGLLNSLIGAGLTAATGGAGAAMKI